MILLVSEEENVVGDILLCAQSLRQ